MAPRILLSSIIPVILLPPNAPRTLTTTAPTTDLSALLTHSPAEDSVTLTLSDLSTRLLLLHHVLTAAQYAPLRESQSLLIDFAAFPTHLCDLLQRATATDDYVATLRLPPILEKPSSGTDNLPAMTTVTGIGVEQAILSIVQTSAVKSITHIELQLRRASHEELMAAVAGRAREAELADARATHLQRVLDEERGRARDDAARSTQQITELSDKIKLLEREVAETSAERNRLVQLDDEVRRLREELSERDERLETARADIAETSKVRDENDELRAVSDRSNATAARAEEARKRAIIERDDAKRETERVVAERDSLAAEITRGNDIIGRLQNEVRTLRAKAKVKSTVLGRQEEVVNRLETRVAELERDVRRARDRAALLEVEKDGLNEQVSSMKHKLEENAAVLASDQQVIAYLNRELNERAVNELTGATNLPSTSGKDRVTGGTSAHPADVGVSSGIA